MDIESLNNTHVHYEESIEVGERPKPSRNFNSKFNDDEDSDCPPIQNDDEESCKLNNTVMGEQNLRSSQKGSNNFKSMRQTNMSSHKIELRNALGEMEGSVSEFKIQD